MLRSNDAPKNPDTEFPADELGIARVLVDGSRPLYRYEGKYYKTYAAALGARGGAVGGLSTSPAKAAASRENGKLGGRPKTTAEVLHDAGLKAIPEPKDI